MLLPATLLLAQFIMEKEVTLVTDGQTRQLRSRAGLVGQLLREQAIALQAGDLVEPGPPACCSAASRCGSAAPAASC